MNILKIKDRIKLHLVGMNKIDRLMILVIVIYFVARIAYLFFDPIRG